MSDNPANSEVFDFWDLSGTDLTPRLQGTIGEVFGNKWAVGGYNALEEIQRAVRLESMSRHDKETQQWYRALTLYFVAQYGEWDLSSTNTPEERFQTVGVQMDLLGLGLSSAKVAIDTLLAGYYSVAFATIRHMSETVLQCLYLDAFPERAFLWRSELTPENVKRMAAARMRDKLVKRAKSFQPETDRKALTEYIEAVYRSWELLSGGAHPSSSGLSQVVWPDAEGQRQVGGTYERYMILGGFDHGFFALQGLLERFGYTNRVDDEWRRRFDHWRQYVSEFRMNLATDPAVQDFAAKLEAARQASAEIAGDTEPDNQQVPDRDQERGT